MAITEEALVAYVSHVAERTGGLLDRQSLQETFGFPGARQSWGVVIHEAQGKGGGHDGFNVSSSASERRSRLSVLSGS
jgi:hypothetical protein